MAIAARARDVFGLVLVMALGAIPQACLAGVAVTGEAETHYQRLVGRRWLSLAYDGSAIGVRVCEYLRAGGVVQQCTQWVHLKKNAVGYDTPLTEVVQIAGGIDPDFADFFSGYPGKKTFFANGYLDLRGSRTGMHFAMIGSGPANITYDNATGIWINDDLLYEMRETHPLSTTPTKPVFGYRLTAAITQQTFVRVWNDLLNRASTLSDSKVQMLLDLVGKDTAMLSSADAGRLSPLSAFIRIPGDDGAAAPVPASLPAPDPAPTFVPTPRPGAFGTGAKPVVAAAATLPAVAQGPRLALVVGNGAYQGGLGSLANASGDARLIAQHLTAVGFRVQLVENADQRTLKAAIRKFGRDLGAAGSHATGLFYYAGHGVQAGGINYLVPIGAVLENEGDLDLDAVRADAVISEIADAHVATGIVILDACRNMPLRRAARDAERGLARMEAPGGVYIAYSTAPGQVASDGSGANSPFATALASEIAQPDETITDAITKVRIAVYHATQGHQTVWESSSLFERFMFNPQH